jgi:hypothetical protein
MFEPALVAGTLKAIEASVASHVAGVSVTTTSATYGGLVSTCLVVHSATPGTYCASNAAGILTYATVAGTTLTLTNYSAHPASSLFSPPAGATTETLPSGV